jgi:hypothetical protein
MIQPVATAPFKNPIDRMTAAESVATLLSRLNVDKFPTEERMAVATVQIAAIDDWLAAYLEMRGASQRQNASPAPRLA